MKHSELKKAALRKAGVRAEYQALAPEFELLRQMLRARAQAGMSQADVAALMGTQAPAITRLESALSGGGHSPSIDTLKRYAEAVGYELQLKLVGKRKGASRRAISDKAAA
ncbi:MAG: helix-turn-helix transcriptional regulator [Proteobacteria bacterium]|uniref:helix-turn-helix domain-containing protein n=1 Tax=Rudaea sp. TaxID=2136325 RepID=UPI001DA2DFE3|nr:helix-turn-helix transcriptional regulator [Pseudomonadota bacterium]MBS0568846.1 helix-turn-helix transcriptional regulator [Pseudomonadota bacterium]